LETHHGHQYALNHIRKAINFYSELPLVKRDIIMKWKKIIQSLTPEFTPYNYLHTMTIGLPTGIFSYQFDITNILHFLQTEEISHIALETKLMQTHVDQEVWSTDTDSTPYPIVLLETPLLPRGFLLSGHNSIMDAKSKGNKEVEVYVLTEMEYLSLMHDNISKAMYMFHRDLQNLLSTPIPPPFHTLFISKYNMFINKKEVII